MNIKEKRKLQIRFVALSMAALLLLQSTIVAISIFHSYNEMVEKSDMLLSQLYDNPASNVRYFSVKVHPGKGTVRLGDVQHVSITPEQAGAYTKIALDSNQDRGFVDGYRYHIHRNNDGIRVLFLSRSSSLDMFRTSASNLIWISLVGLLVVGIILSFVSGWIVKPFLDNQRKQKEFITAASHELKTPLTVISTNAQLLQTEIGDNSWIDGILHQVDHLTQMAHALVALAKAEEHSTATAQGEFCLPDAVRETIAPYIALADQKKLCLSTTIPSDFSYTGCKKDIQQLLCILLDNAFKYCDDTGEISVVLKPLAKGGLITVSNNATTLTSADAENLTQRFYRGGNAAGTEGFGLGLAIAQSIALRHNGKLAVSLTHDQIFVVEVTLQ